MSGKDLRIVYMGTPDFAVAPLRALVEGGYNVVAVVTTPDKPSGRGLKLNESAVKKYAVECGLQVLQPEKLKDDAFVEHFRALNVDLAVVVAFRMLPEVIWSMPKYGTFNLHASLLPQYRGAAPINWAIINGETMTGVTTFLLNSRIDEGAIIGKREVDILPEDNVSTLHDKLMHVGTKLVVDTVEQIATGDLRTQSQQGYLSEDLKPAPKIFRDTCKINFSNRGKDIVNLIRGLSPYPAAWADLNCDRGEREAETEMLSIKIFQALFEEGEHRFSCGEIVLEKAKLKVACSDGFVVIEELQPAGKRRMTSTEFVNGFRGVDGCVFE